MRTKVKSIAKASMSQVGHINRYYHVLKKLNNNEYCRSSNN